MATQTHVFVSKLTSLSQTLNSASDLLSSQLAEIEKALNKLALGITVWVDLQVGNGQDDPELEQIGYGQHSTGKWCLLHGWGNPMDEQWQQKPLLESPRDTRVLAVKKLPELLAKLLEGGEQCAEKTSEAAGEARKIAVALNTVSVS